MPSSIPVNVPLLIDGPQLLDEFEAAVGERPTVERDGGRAVLTFQNVDVDTFTVRQVVASHTPNDLAQFDGLVTKARAVWRGEDTFTQAQAQKILAGLVLVVARYLR